MNDYTPDLDEPEQRGDAWRPPHGPLTKLVAWLILAMIAAGTVVMVIVTLR
jgi:hypothetical protein